MRDQAVRLHLSPFLRDRDLRSLDPATVDSLEAHLIRKEITRHRSKKQTEAPEEKHRLSRRTIDMTLGTLRLILVHAQVQGIVASNAVDTWKATLPSRGRRRVSSPRKQIVQDAVLEAEEREKLLEAFEAQQPHYYPLVLFLAETGCRIAEPLALAWDDVDVLRSEARLYRQKTGQTDFVELSERLTKVLSRLEPDLRPLGLLVFRTPQGAPVRYENFKRRVWDPISVDLFGKGRRVTPHTQRHTWASLHLSRGTPLEWVRRMGGWASTQMLLDAYSHFLPREMRGFSNALSTTDRTTPNQARSGEHLAAPVVG